MYAKKIQVTSGIFYSIHCIIRKLNYLTSYFYSMVYMYSKQIISLNKPALFHLASLFFQPKQVG